MPRLTDVGTDALRLVMHCLDSAQLLQLATCCRATLIAAQSDFAWRHSLLRVASNTQGLPKLLKGSLIRHASIHLSLVLSQKFVIHQPSAAMDAVVLRVLRPCGSRLRGFDAALSRYIPLLCWQTILADACLSSLRVLRLGSAEIAAQCNEAMLEAICGGMQSLTKLDLRLFEPRSDIWGPLADARALRTLSIVATDAVQSHHYGLPPLAPNVTRLQLTGILHLFPLFTRFIDSPVLSQLSELTLGDLPSNPAIWFEQFWIQLLACRVVHLFRVCKIDACIAFAHQAPVLRALRITPTDDFAADWVPSSDAVCALLRAAPELIVTLVIPPLAGRPRSVETRARRFDDAKSEFPSRCVLVLQSGPS